MAGYVVLTLILAMVGYFALARPWILKMGASRNEVTMLLPGDGLVVDPNMKYTQAVTINAPYDVVWAYLIQVGYRRAGWYNWDAFNRLAAKDYFYENNSSANRTIQELQDIKAGDQIFLTPQIGMEVEIFEPNKCLMLTGHEDNHYIVTWTYYLKQLKPDRTRLVVRWNSKLGSGLLFKLMNLLVIEPGGAGIQQSLMLRGIKKRAEKERPS